jgi:hypothetical protein
MSLLIVFIVIFVIIVIVVRHNDHPSDTMT